MPVKQCRGPCGREFDLDEGFSKDPSKGDGHRNVCRWCDAAARERRRNPNADAMEDDDALRASIIAGGDSLIAFGTPMQRACAEALIKAGNVVDAALELQLEPTQLRGHLSELKRRAAARGWAPASDMTKTTPLGFHVKGVSTYYRAVLDSEGNPTGQMVPSGQWVKTKRDEESKYEALLDALQAIVEPLRAVASPIPVAGDFDEDLMCVYPMGDPHLGMLAWPAETGNAFDLRIAEDNLFAAVDHLVSLAPPAKLGVVMNLGDFFHSDNKKGETTRGTPVDVDGRWPKVLAAGIRVMRRLIDRALEKHEHVHVVNEIGNHDDHTSIMLSIALDQFYEREPRVTIDTSPEPFHWIRFGKVLIGVHHGDKTKPTNLLGVMACDRAQDWGETEYRYWYIGHVHHDSLKELPGVTVESFRTLAGKDAWHHGQGYRSGRDMKMDVIHRQFGKINRHIVGINQILASISQPLAA